MDSHARPLHPTLHADAYIAFRLLRLSSPPAAIPANAKHVGSGNATTAGVSVAPVPSPYLNVRSDSGVPAVQADWPLLFKSNTCRPGPMMSYAGLSLAG